MLSTMRIIDCEIRVVHYLIFLYEIFCFYLCLAVVLHARGFFLSIYATHNNYAQVNELRDG